MSIKGSMTFIKDYREFKRQFKKQKDFKTNADPIDLDGHKKGIKNLSNCLTTGGTLYLSTTIGRPRIEFNAYRVFDINYHLDLFAKHQLSLKYFSYVNEKGELIENADPFAEEGKNNFNLAYGCGIFELIKN
jgi:hypothetical protein